MAIAPAEPINRIRIIKRWDVIGGPGQTTPSVVETKSNPLRSKPTATYMGDTITSTSR
jgi:hypothetical protein